MAGQQSYQVELSTGEVVWVAREPGDTAASIQRKRLSWRNAHRIDMRADAAAEAESARPEVEAAGHSLEGYDATFWVPPAPEGKGSKGTGQWELPIWVLFRRDDSDPAFAVCPDAVEVSQQEFDEHWIRELWLSGSARDIAEAPGYVKSLQSPED